jgi:predicted transcriptional regulator
MDDVKFSNAAVWLMMLREGGRWTAAEVGERLSLDQTAAAGSLRSMYEFGTVQKWERSETNDRVRYGVTVDCKIPRGVTVKDVAGLMGAAK